MSPFNHGLGFSFVMDGELPLLITEMHPLNVSFMARFINSVTQPFSNIANLLVRKQSHLHNYTFFLSVKHTVIL